MLNKFIEVPKAVIVDIGCFTADYLMLRNGRGDLSACDSLENGVILLYNRICSKCSSDMDLLLEECDIDTILQNKSHDFDETVVRIVEEQAQSFIDDRWANCGSE